jgi:hypothetical protein
VDQGQDTASPGRPLDEADLPDLLFPPPATV